MILVAEVCLVALLCPPRVNIFVALLAGIVVPQLIATPLLDFRVFLAGIALPGCDNEAGVYYLALVDYKASVAICA